MDELNFKYIDSDGAARTVKGLTSRTDNGGKIWIWSEQLEQNIAIKGKTESDALRSALDSLLFIIGMQREKIKEFYELKEKVAGFIESVTDKED